MDNSKNIGIIILAAGSSSRLGHPKQLVEINGQPLLVKITESAIASGCAPVVVVLGAYFKKIKPVVENLPAHVLNNKKWETGMGSTIAHGMDYILKNHPTLEAIILMVCDQYFLSEKIIDQLIIKWINTDNRIIAAKYGKTIGVPALFSKELFFELNNLRGKIGAKKIIAKYHDQLATINFAEGVIDLDTAEDLSKIIQYSSKLNF